MNIVILGLSITSSWGNGHATTYRALVRALHARGHRVLFLECDKPWYAGNRDLKKANYCEIALYDTIEDLQSTHALAVAEADLVIVGSFVPDGIAVSEWVEEIAGGVTAFYDIDTPVTLEALEQGKCEYLNADLIASFDVYFSFTGGSVLRKLEREFGARRAAALYCSVDTEFYRPLNVPARWDLAYLGTYSDDRQPTLDRLLVEPARLCPTRDFAVVGSMYPDDLPWPANVARIGHLPPQEHAIFYNQQRFTLNVTRAAMVGLGYSPSVRLFEAAACGTPIISDSWAGLDTFFVPGKEIILADSPEDVLLTLEATKEEARQEMSARARTRILRAHTAGHRAAELEETVTRIRRGLRSDLTQTIKP
jgi:spore maturation protein CgeB